MDLGLTGKIHYSASFFFPVSGRRPDIDFLPGGLTHNIAVYAVQEHLLYKTFRSDSLHVAIGAGAGEQ